MKYKLALSRNWHYQRDRFYTPAVYRVPEDIPEDHAAALIAAGAGSKISEKGPAPENKARRAAPEKKAGGPTGAAKPASSPPAAPAKGRKTSKKREGAAAS